MNDENKKKFDNLILLKNISSLKDIIDKIEEFDKGIKNRKENDIQIIKKIINDSEIKLILDSENIDSIKENEYYQVKYLDDIDLKEILESSFLLKNKKNTENKRILESIIKQNQMYDTYSNIVHKIYKIKNLLNESYLKDYKSPSELIIKIKNEKVNIILNNNTIAIDDYIIQLEEKLNKILRDTINAYDNNFILTFLYGKLFINFFNYILDEKGNDIKQIVSYLTGGINIQNYKNTLEEIKRKYNLKENENIFQIISEFLDLLFEENKISFNNLIKSYQIVNQYYLKNYLPGIYIYKSENNFEKEIIKIYFFLCNDIPKAFTILFCTEYTSIEELISFFIRFFKSNYPIPFFIINLDKLKNQIKYDLFLFLKKNEMRNVYSYLIFIFTRKENKENFESLKTINLFRKFFILEEIIENPNIINNNHLYTLIEKLTDVEIFNSNCSGVGKTTLIKQFAKKNNFNFINFPFGENDNDFTLINRLKKISF